MVKRWPSIDDFSYKKLGKKVFEKTDRKDFLVVKVEQKKDACIPLVREKFRHRN